MKSCMKIGQGLYLLFAGLALYALNLASNGALVRAAQYLLSWIVWDIQVFVF